MIRDMSGTGLPGPRYAGPGGGTAGPGGGTAGPGGGTAGPGGAVLQACGLVKRYGPRVALAGFALAAAPGEVVGLVGHNGAGKTTFAEIVSGLARPDAGRVTVGGIDVAARPHAARRLLGVCPQEPALYPSVTVAEHLELFGALAGLHRAALRAAAARIAEQLLLTGVLSRPAGLLSGGQRRRAQAATALIADRPLLLLDEPTAGADPQTRAALLALVSQRAAAGAAVVYITHYLPELAELDATLAVARHGRVIARGRPAELLAGLPGEVRARFGGPVPPRLRHLGRVTGVAGDELRLAAADPARALAGLLAAGAVPSAVDIRQPGLDDLYRLLAGKEADDARATA
jgi:ABC-2 type transport system ATP-binding protein